MPSQIVRQEPDADQQALRKIHRFLLENRIELGLTVEESAEYRRLKLKIEQAKQHRLQR